MSGENPLVCLYFLCIVPFFRLKPALEEAARSKKKKKKKLLPTTAHNEVSLLLRKQFNSHQRVPLFLFFLSPQDTLCQQRRLLPPPTTHPQTTATDLVTHTQPYGTAGTGLHTVIRGMVPDTCLCCGAG